MVPLKKSLKLDLKVAALVYLAGLHNKWNPREWNLL
jgi:hypothetical protein